VKPTASQGEACSEPFSVTTVTIKVVSTVFYSTAFSHK
jgi:hypothetical protein